MFHLDTYIIVSLALVVFSHVLMLAAMFVPFKNTARAEKVAWAGVWIFIIGCTIPAVVEGLGI